MRSCSINAMVINLFPRRAENQVSTYSYVICVGQVLCCILEPHDVALSVSSLGLNGFEIYRKFYQRMVLAKYL